MENKDAKTDYLEFVKVGGPKVRNGRNYTIGIMLFLFEILSHYFLYVQGVQVPPEKSHLHLECEFQPKIAI